MSSSSRSRTKTGPLMGRSASAHASTTYQGIESIASRLQKSQSVFGPTMHESAQEQQPGSSSSSVGSDGNSSVKRVARSIHDDLSRSPLSGMSDIDLNSSGAIMENPDNNSSGSDVTVTMLKSASSTSLRRSELVLNLDEASMGSPIAKRPMRRSSHHHHHNHHHHSHSHTTPSSSNSITTTPSRTRSASNHDHRSSGGIVANSATNVLHRQVIAAQNAAVAVTDFATPGAPASKIRRQISVENFLAPTSRGSPFGVPGGATDPSVHHIARPSALAQTMVTAEDIESAEAKISMDAQQAISISEHMRQHLTEPKRSFYTPQSYKLVKPFQAAFMSEGLLSKKTKAATEATRAASSSVLSSSSSAAHLPPNTPCKPSSFSTQTDVDTQPDVLNTPSHRPLGSSSNNKQLLSVASSTSSSSNAQNQHHLPLASDEDSHHLSIMAQYATLTTPQDDHFNHGSSSDCDFPPTPTKGLAGSASSFPAALWLNRESANVTSPEDQRTDNDQFASSPVRNRKTLAIEPASPNKTYFETMFHNLQLIGSGEFSEVYEVQLRNVEPPTPFAVKKTRAPSTGYKSRARRFEEVNILRALGRHEHIVEFFDSWEEQGHLYIQTELCENGSLDVFLQEYGKYDRLDEFRVWKVLVELSMVSCEFSKNLNWLIRSGFGSYT